MDEDFIKASLKTQFLEFPEAQKASESEFSRFPASCYNALPSILSLTSSGHELEGVHNIFSRCVSLRKLDLEGCHLMSLTDELLHLSRLVNLHLKRCNIPAFPENFASKFEVVRYLEISFSQITQIPSDIHLCGQLEDMILNDNKILSIPLSLFSLGNLKALILTGNRISEVSENVARLQTLMVLMLSHNCITSVPVTIAYLTRLKHLQVSPNHCHPDTSPYKFRSISLVKRESPSITIQYPPSQIATAPWRVLHNYCHAVCTVRTSRELIMPDMGISSIGQDLIVFTTITTLNLRGNRLAELPGEVALMQSLKSVNISKNSFLQFPVAISNTTSLVELDVSGNNIVQVPVWISNLCEMKSLDVSANSLRTLPLEIATCKSLTMLDTSGNLWEWLPQSLVDRGFAFLKKYYSKIVQSQNSILDLKNLDLKNISLQVFFESSRFVGSIDFSENSLSELMDEFAIFETVRTINLSSNKFSNIPKPLQSLKQLTDLNFACNDFAAISSDIQKLANLKFLSFKSNVITSIHPNISLSRQLVSLDLSSNHISMLSEVYFHEMFQLASLFLQNNCFEIFPTEVFSATSLTELNLSANPFTVLPTELIVFKDIVLHLDLHKILRPSQKVCSQGLNAIFQWIYVLNSTKRSKSSALDLTAYSLTQLPPELLDGETFMITTIILKANSIQTLPKECIFGLRSVRVLDYSMNSLHEIPEAIFGLTNLEQLDLSCNNITLIPDIISQLTNLKLLNLVGNNISTIPIQVGYLPLLNELLLNSEAVTSPPRAITKLGDAFVLSFLKLLHFCHVTGALLLPPLGIEHWFPDLLNVMSHLTDLSIASNSFFELEFDACHFSNLVTFDASFNKISRIKALNLLTRLERLNLSNNLLNSPEGLFEAINLKTLLLSSNLISDFPDQISCISLEHFNISHNPLTDISMKLLTCTKLKHFDVSNSSVSYIPEFVYLMESLTEMVLTGVTLRSPPPEIVLAGFDPIKKYSEIMYHGRMQESMNMSSMSLKSIPEEIYQFSHLTELNLDDNLLSGTLPSRLLKSLHSLQKLHIKGHKYTFPPKELIETGQVETIRRFYDDFERGFDQKKLKLIHYFLVKFPPEANVMDLVTLDLRDNLLSNLGISLRSNMISTLTKINLFANKFTDVPEVIFKLSHLTSLNLGSNLIKSLKGNYQHLKKLAFFDVSNNFLETLDRSLIVLDELTSLDISGHRFVSYPDVLSSLKSLQNVALNISNFTELRKLNLDQNVDLPPFHVVKGGMQKICELCTRFREARYSNFMKLANMGMPVLMDEITKYVNLTNLDLSHNSIVILKAEICTLTGIVCLNVSHNCISMIPNKISQLSSLESLLCAHNRISNFPESLGAIETLAELSLEGNPLESPSVMLAEKPFPIIKDYFEQLYKSRSTRALNLRGKYLIEFHFEWEEQMMHMALQSIDLHNNMLSHIPPQISAFCGHSLVELQLDYNQLNNSIWGVVKDLILLTHFSSSHNILSSVPEEVSGLTSLKFLNLSFNHIRELSPSLASLKKLAALYLQSNLLTKISFSFHGFENLAELNLTGNNLEESDSCDEIEFAAAGQRLLLANNLMRNISEKFCFQCCTIKGLNLSHNNISLLPDGVSLLTRLSYLFLENNLLCLLPYSMGQLTGLKELNLQDNFLTILPSSLGLCTQLSSLNLHGNPLTMFPDNTKLWALPLGFLFDYLDDFLITPILFEGSHLSELRLSNMKLRSIPLNVMTTKEVIKYVQSESEKMIPQRILARVSQGVESRSALANHFGQGTLLTRRFLKEFARAKNDIERTELLKKNESLDIFGRPLDLVDRAIKTGGHISMGIEKVAARYKEVDERKVNATEMMGKLQESKDFGAESKGEEETDSDVSDPLEQQEDMKYNKLTAEQKRRMDENIMIKVGESVSEMALRRISGQMSQSTISEKDSIGSLVYHFDVLQMDHNELASLPKILYRLYNISVLNCQFNQIDSIRQEFKYLSSLTHLRLDTNRISSISPEISCLSRLQILNLKRNMLQYDALDSVSWDKLVSLKQLDLSENSISCEHRFLPEQLYLIPNLQKLGLQKCYLRRDPDSGFRHLTQLQELDLSYNFFTGLCLEFRYLRHCLKSLNCEQTPIHFPDSEVIASSPASSVCRLLQQMWLAKNNGLLFVQKNDLKIFPMVILKWGFVDPLEFISKGSTNERKSNLNLDIMKHQVNCRQKLRTAAVLILLAGAEIREMATVPGFHLKQLNLVGNRIQVLPAEISLLMFLEDLDISENELVSMHAQIGSLGRLTYLNVSNNKLQELPDEMCKNVSLIDFRCAHNELRYIPFKMGDLRVLKWLDASSNEMSYPPQTIVCQGPLVVVEFMKSCYSEFVQRNALSLKNSSILFAPMGLFKIDNLLSMDLSNNLIVTLPSRIDSASFLNSLILNNNELISIPASIGFLTDLTCLHLSSNRMRALPPTMAKCAKLCLLDIRKNAFTTMPAFVLRAFEQLKDFWYSENDIRHIHVPDPPPSLPHLQTLKSAQNSASELFTPYLLIFSITSLDFSGNLLRFVPDELANLRNLVTLNLSKNKLRCLSTNFGALTSLTELFLQYNQLKELSASFPELQALQYLKLHDNPLKKCPFELRWMTGLTRLTLSGCSLKMFDEGFVGAILIMLTMSNNGFNLLPTNIMNMHALQTLTFNSNALAGLPPTISGLTSMTELWLSDNLISVLPETLFQLTKLVILALNGNSITSLHASLGWLVNLEQLYLQNNLIFELPNTIVSIQKLQVLNLAGNTLETCPQVRPPRPCRFQSFCEIKKHNKIKKRGLCL
jgi:Leucine-rich repeat (LRR) protein